MFSKFALQPVYDGAGNLVGATAPNGKKTTFAAVATDNQAPTSGIVVSSAAPNNSDGRADGTIHIQTA